MSYLPRSRRPSYGRKIFFLLAIFISGVVLFSLFGNLLITVISPLWRGENAFSQSLRNSTGYFRSKAVLIDENTLLKNRVKELEISLSAQATVSASSSIALTGTSGYVLTHPPQSPYDLVVVDIGQGEAYVGERVFLPEGPEVGIVSEIFGRFAKVKLYTNVGEKTNAVLERHEVPVVIEGVGAGNFRVMVPRETEVEVGDRIISPTQEASLMAIVENVELEATDSFKSVYAKSPTNVFSIRFVNIHQ